MSLPLFLVPALGTCWGSHVWLGGPQLRTGTSGLAGLSLREATRGRRCLSQGGWAPPPSLSLFPPPYLLSQPPCLPFPTTEFSLFFPLGVHSWGRVCNLTSPGEAAPGSKGDERMPHLPIRVPWVISLLDSSSYFLSRKPAQNSPL